MSDTNNTDTVRAFAWNAVPLTFGGKARQKDKATGVAPAPFTKQERVLDWEKMPEASKQFLARYGAQQYIADGSAGAKTQAEFEAGIDSRFDKIAAGDFSRVTGERAPSDDVETVAKRIIREEINSAAADRKLVLTKEQRAKAVATKWEKQEQKYRQLAEIEIADRKARASDEDINALLDDLLGLGDGETETEEGDDEGEETSDDAE